ncbi:DUF4440 domain-containing protein [Ensifer sp. ENS07]|uniref:nuclear transport factor 2 family protein n=1 Tax=Ensifer sp. ENS07 TaxID=2769274 RepID=UPI00072A4455|nr:DUF4440 domain-containing protein [Ensifer sp. ENS07]KSV61838.1 hypothetical protein N182_37745 [Sinorhizobium sp. GL2]MBD9641387.1 DUF4440 domain-containing protein [Ensifer sp. ENS07]
MLTSVPSLEEMQSLEEALHRPEVRRSRAAIEMLLADGFVEFGASGSVYDRTTTIDLLVEEGGILDGELRTANYALTPISKDAVLLTYETKTSYSDGSTRCVLRSSIWKHDGAKWQMFFHQGTVRP